MRQHHWSQGLFLLGLAALTAALIPACGGSGKSASAVPPLPGTDHNIHVSTVSGVVVVPASQTAFVVRQITFTPTNASDVILYVIAEGTKNVTASGGLTDVMSIVILDAGGKPLSGPSDKTSSTTIGTNIPYALGGSIGFPSTLQSTNPGTFPSASYTIQLVMATSASWSGQIDSVQFRIVTAENITVVIPSGNIVG